MILASRCGGDPGPRRVDELEAISDILSVSVAVDMRISVVEDLTESVLEDNRCDGVDDKA